jgi:hypothetical protein
VNPNGIVVSSSIKNSWGIGSTIIITSFTQQWNQFQQVRTIIGMSDYDNPPDGQYVELILNEPFVRPTTSLDDTNFAVEVALLSKNIVFTSTRTGTDLDIGGHFWFFHTPTMMQKVVGIDLQYFGQQGRLGRYPIHFHYCHNVLGTYIAQNTIRHSLQRCIVIHGTDNVQIHDNVAYDTAGHCFVLEDGIETGNQFVNILGIMTRKPKKIIPEFDFANNGIESDISAVSTFWITNPTNLFINNVAAGSEDSGFWFELLKRGMYASLYTHLNPPSDALLLFSNNVAHSNSVVRQ